MDKSLVMSLIVSSLRDPRAAAGQVMGYALGRDALWTALALVAIINTFLVLFVLQFSGPTMPLPRYFDTPLACSS